MRRKGDGRTLAERIHGTPPPERPRIKPCWVTDRYGRLPGLLMEWRHTVAAWAGRVVRPALEVDGWIVVEEWLPAGAAGRGHLAEALAVALRPHLYRRRRGIV
jgi:hypothetical protein